MYNIQIYFQAGKLQMKSRSPGFHEFIQFINWLQKKLQAENGVCNGKQKLTGTRVVNNYSSSFLYSSSILDYSRRHYLR